MKHSGNKSFGFLIAASVALLMVCATLLGGCARSGLNGWAQNSPVIQPQAQVVNLGVAGESSR